MTPTPQDASAAAQLVVNTLGFIVLGCPFPLPVGTVIPSLKGTAGYGNLNASVVIIGPATPEDARKQDEILGLSRDFGWNSVFLYKCVAE